MKMTKEAAASALNYREYGDEGDKELFAAMKESGLVAVFGASDDLMEFRGAIYDEVGCYSGGAAYVTPRGLFEQTCDNDRCPHEGKLRDEAVKIAAVWDRDGYSWVYETEIPHVTFDIVEGADRYCRGIVFALSDVPS